MTKIKRIRFAKAALTGITLLALGACASTEQTAKIADLEEKVYEALRNSASAKIDAATALKMAVDLESKVK